MRRILFFVLVAAACIVPVAHDLHAQRRERSREPDPGQVGLQGDLSAITGAARREARLERARRIAPFDLKWATR